MLYSAFLQTHARTHTLTFIRALFIWRAERQHCHCQFAFKEGGLESRRHLQDHRCCSDGIIFCPPGCYSTGKGAFFTSPSRVQSHDIELKSSAEDEQQSLLEHQEMEELLRRGYKSTTCAPSNVSRPACTRVSEATQISDWQRSRCLCNLPPL